MATTIDVRTPKGWVMVHALTLLAFVQGVGALVLGWLTWATIGDANGTLTWPRIWAGLMIVGGIGALLISLNRLRNEFTWSLAGAMISTAMFGRSLDIIANYDEFIGRPNLAVAVWGCMGASTFAAWVAVGSMAGWTPPDDG